MHHSISIKGQILSTSPLVELPLSFHQAVEPNDCAIDQFNVYGDQKNSSTKNQLPSTPFFSYFKNSFKLVVEVHFMFSISNQSPDLLFSHPKQSTPLDVFLGPLLLFPITQVWLHNLLGFQWCRFQHHVHQPLTPSHISHLEMKSLVYSSRGIFPQLNGSLCPFYIQNK